MTVYETKFNHDNELKEIYFLYDDGVTYKIDCSEAGITNEMDFVVNPVQYEDYFKVLEDYTPPPAQKDKIS